MWRADVTDALPARARAYEGVPPPNDGTNCWGTALYVTGIFDHYRHATREEIKHQSEGSPLCRRRTADEALEPGDIVTIRQPPPGCSSLPFVDTHAYVYISESLVFSKNSSRREDVAGLQPMARIYDEYQVPPEQRHLSDVRGPIPRSQEKRVLWDNAYTCVSLDSFLETHPEYQSHNLPDDLRQALRTTAAFEAMMTADSWNLIEMDPAQRQTLAQTAELVLRQAQDELARDHAQSSPVHRFYWQRIFDSWIAFYAQRMATDRDRATAPRIEDTVIAVDGNACTLTGKTKVPKIFAPQIVRVEVCFDDDTTWLPAKGTRAWRYRGILPPGAHTARIRAVADGGRPGPPVGPLSFNIESAGGDLGKSLKDAR